MGLEAPRLVRTNTIDCSVIFCTNMTKYANHGVYASEFQNTKKGSVAILSRFSCFICIKFPGLREIGREEGGRIRPLVR